MVKILMYSLNQIIDWLIETDPPRLQQLWQQADDVRKQQVGEAIHLRGLIEISNYCVRQCTYCGIRADNKKICRYRMAADEIHNCAHLAQNYGYGTVVLQAGEDYGIEADWLAGIIRQIKSATNLAITLSLGERHDDELRLWREAGADRYLLRFETSNRALYEAIHPNRGRTISDRIMMLRRLKSLGYETGSGVLVGIPGQSYEDLAKDILLFGELGLHMIGVGPYIAHPDTPLAQHADSMKLVSDRQVPSSDTMACKVIALARILCPGTNIPSTTALATINPKRGRMHGLTRGANVIMPNLTPSHYRSLYEIYPAKAGSHETAEVTNVKLKEQIIELGRVMGNGRGDSVCYGTQIWDDESSQARLDNLTA